MTELKKAPVVKKDKIIIQDFEGQVKDIRQQLSDQVRCFEIRTDVETSIFLEVQEYFKRRAEIELDYSRNLEKLARQITAKHKAEKQKRDAWPLFSLYHWWQQLTEDTKSEARFRAVVADVYTNYVASKLSSHSEQLQRISKRCREICSDAHQEILRVLGELHTAMKTYQMCYAASTNAETKFRTVETQKQRFEESFPKKVGNRKHRFVERELEKKQAKYVKLQLKALKARNEYILCIEAANAALHKYFADDLSNVADCMDVGMNHWLSSLINSLLEARRQLHDHNALQDNSTKAWIQTYDARVDKRRFLETQHATFTLPRKFEFRPYSGDGDQRGLVTADSFMEEDLRQRCGQLDRRLRELRIENEEIWKTYETAERKVIELQRQPELKVVDLFLPAPPKTPPLPPHTTASGTNILSNPVNASSITIGVIKNEQSATSRVNKNICRETEAVLQKRKVDMCEMEEYLLEKFRQHLLTSNLIRRLEARQCQIQGTLGISAPALMSESMISFSNGGRTVNDIQNVDEFLDSCHSLTSSFAVAESGDMSAALSSSTIGRVASFPARRKRVGRAAETAQEETGGAASAVERRPRLFGGSLEEYVEATGEEIPLIIRSCIRMLSMYGLHHQGIFRVSGSQLEINHFKEAFERGEDPLTDVTDASDVNSVSGVLKLYFREMLEPLFPMFMFDQFVDCTRSETKMEVISKVKDLLKTLPRPVYVVMRYLFGFLNHLSEFSDENMMDPFNLAICFGPTLLPIPESRDQVFFHNYVNELMKNMIIYHEDIFPKDDPLLYGGIWYEKYLTADDLAGMAAGDEEDGDGDDDGARYESVDGDKFPIIGSSRNLTVGRQIREHRCDDLETSATDEPILGPCAVSPANSSDRACDLNATQRTFSGYLNLSNHTSLQASPESPIHRVDDTTTTPSNEVWQRRPTEAPIIDVECQSDNKSVDADTVQRASDSSAENPMTSPRQNQALDYQRKRPEATQRQDSSWSRGEDGDCSSSANSDSEDFPTGFVSNKKPIESSIALQFRSASTSSSNYSEGVANRYHFKNGALPAAAASYARHCSVSSEPAKEGITRDSLIGSLKRLSLSSYGVTPASNDAIAAKHLTSPVHGSEDLDFIQRADFSAAANGLSPTSLKEIQVELKAVLTSLESYAHQHKPRNGSSTSADGQVSSSSHDLAGEADRPDLVQNLPSPALCAPDAAPSSPASCLATAENAASIAQWFNENEQELLTDGEPNSLLPSIEAASGSASKAHAGPPVPRKPWQVSATLCQQECSSIESDEDTVL